MTEFKEIKTRPFAFLKISANTLAAHWQAAQADTQTKVCQRTAILQPHNNYVYEANNKI